MGKGEGRTEEDERREGEEAVMSASFVKNRNIFATYLVYYFF